jgi:hypothetical protein
MRPTGTRLSEVLEQAPRFSYGVPDGKGLLLDMGPFSLSDYSIRQATATRRGQGTIPTDLSAGQDRRKARSLRICLLGRIGARHDPYGFVCRAGSAQGTIPTQTQTVDG